MVSPENNLLVRLHKGAWRQDENFLTEALAHLLRHLLENEPQAAANLLGYLTEGFFALGYEEARGVEVRTQTFTAEGTPDLQLRAGEQLAILEVKSESDVREEQLSRYRDLLRDSGTPSTALVLLTRYPVTLSEGKERPKHVRWYQVAEWLDQERSRYQFQPVSAYLVNQFLDFLSARNMIMGQVTWELPGGVRALRALRDMLYEAAVSTGYRAQFRVGQDYIGVHLDKPNYWAGIYYDRPEVLIFETCARKVRQDAAERPNLPGRVYKWTTEQALGWYRELNLDSEAIHFFARSPASQRQVLEQFLRECRKTVEDIEIREEAKGAPPSEPSGTDGTDHASPPGNS
jgi:hypothetical protein